MPSPGDRTQLRDLCRVRCRRLGPVQAGRAGGRFRRRRSRRSPNRRPRRRLRLRRSRQPQKSRRRTSCRCRAAAGLSSPNSARSGRAVDATRELRPRLRPRIMSRSAFERRRAGETRSSTAGRRRSNRPGNSQASGPRKASDALESGCRAKARLPTEGVTAATSRESLRFCVTEGARTGADTRPRATLWRGTRWPQATKTLRRTRALTISTWRSAPAWCRSPAIPCPSNMRASSPSIAGRASMPASSTSRIWDSASSSGPTTRRPPPRSSG